MKRIDEYNARRRIDNDRQKERKKRARTVAKPFKEKARDEGRCRNPRCIKTSAYYKMAAHHIIHRSFFSPTDPERDNPNNCMPLCFDCHTRYHQGQLGQTRDWLLSNEVAFALDKRGESWLDKHWPK